MAGVKGRSGAPYGNKRNPKISEQGKDKRFGAENANPQSHQIKDSYPPWSIRGAQKHMAAQEIDVTDENALNKMIGRKVLTVAEAIALKQIRKALAGQDRAMEAVTDNVDGKLEQGVKLEDKREVEPINPDEIATHEGLDDAHKQLLGE